MPTFFESALRRAQQALAPDRSRQVARLGNSLYRYGLFTIALDATGLRVYYGQGDRHPVATMRRVDTTTIDEVAQSVVGQIEREYQALDAVYPRARRVLEQALTAGTAVKLVDIARDTGLRPYVVGYAAARLRQEGHATGQQLFDAPAATAGYPTHDRVWMWGMGARDGQVVGALVPRSARQNRISRRERAAIRDVDFAIPERHVYPIHTPDFGWRALQYVTMRRCRTGDCTRVLDAVARRYGADPQFARRVAELRARAALEYATGQRLGLKAVRAMAGGLARRVA